MTGPYLSWATLANSRLRRRALRLAALASLTTAGALTAAAIPGMRAVVLAAAAVALFAAAAAWRRSARAVRPMQLQIDARGEIRVRFSELGAGEVLRPVYVSSWQVVLDSAPYPIAVWSDALGAAAFRRLVVLGRWRLDRAQTDARDDRQDNGRGSGRNGGQGHRHGRQSTPAQGEAPN